MSTETLYGRITRVLEERIHSGEYPVGSRVPSERELSALFGVSRITIRQALVELVRRGLLVRHQGKGTFVAHPQIETSLLGYFKFAEALRRQGLLISTRVLNQSAVPAPPDVAVELGLETGHHILRLQRLRIVDGEPFALETTYLPMERLPGIETAQFHARSLYDVLKSDYHIHPARARETLQPVMLKPSEARLLEVPAECALLILRTTSDLTGRPIEVAHALIPGERCRLLVELWATDATPTNRSAVAR